MQPETFHYQNHELYCDDVPLETIAAAVGTPIYIYSAKRIQENVGRLQTDFSALHPHIHYSLKANANLSIIRLLHDSGLGMDAVSGGEIFRAIRAGVPASEIVFAGVGKTRDELLYALDAGVGWFNVESTGELALLNYLAENADKKPNVALRLNPDVQAKTHHHIATGHGSTKFGMSAETIAQVLRHSAGYPNLRIGGIHVHIGSQLGDVRATVEAVKLAQSLATPDITLLNIGGGFPVKYEDTEALPPQIFADALKPLLTGWQVKLEPGRFIIADAGILVITTLYTKTQHEHVFAITDGSMTELIRPALYDAVHPILQLQQRDEATQETFVTGSVCETADVLRRDARLPPLQPADRLAVMMAGAYGFVMASNYNQRPRPAEILVEDDHWRIIRRRETWQDLIYLEDI